MSKHDEFAHLIPDLPNGIEITAVRAGKPDDYEWYGGRIYKGRRAALSVVIRALPGYEFIPDFEHTGEFKLNKTAL